jgi:hypothetical protein
MVRARLQISEDELQEVVAERRRAIDEAIRGGIGIAHEAVRMAFPVALDAALDLGDLEETNRVVESLAARPRGEVPPVSPSAGQARPRNGHRAATTEAIQGELAAPAQQLAHVLASGDETARRTNRWPRARSRASVAR